MDWSSFPIRLPADAGLRLRKSPKLPTADSTSILVPRLDLNLTVRHAAKGIDECRCQPCIGDQGYIVINRTAAYLVVVVQLCRGKVLGYVDHQVNHPLTYQVNLLGDAPRGQ